MQIPSFLEHAVCLVKQHTWENLSSTPTPCFSRHAREPCTGFKWPDRSNFLSGYNAVYQTQSFKLSTLKSTVNNGKRKKKKKVHTTPCWNQTAWPWGVCVGVCGVLPFITACDDENQTPLWKNSTSLQIKIFKLFWNTHLFRFCQMCVRYWTRQINPLINTQAVCVCPL